MFGWRARLGLLLPMDNAVTEPELSTVLPTGVSAFTVRLTTTDRPAMPANGIDLSRCFDELGVDVIGYGCAETSFLDGTDINRVISDGVTKRTGCPTVTASQAMLEALESFGVTRISLCTPYPDSTNEALRGFLNGAGVDVVRMASRDLVSPMGRYREWDTTNRQEPDTAMQLARQADAPDAQAILISATNLRSLPVISMLEADLGKPVISSNAALLWALLRRAGVADGSVAMGRLGRQPAPAGLGVAR